MNRWKIAVFGDLPIATKVTEWVINNHELELVGCILSNPAAHNNDPWKNTPMLEEYCVSNAIPLFSIEELNSLYPPKSLDLGLVCRFSKILKKRTIDIFDIGCINMHGGLLPEFAGPYSSNYSILFGEGKGGGTLHWIDEGIDTGDIIRRCQFDIEEDDTGYTVFQKTQDALYTNMIDIVMPILHGEMTEFVSQKDLIRKGYKHRYFDLKSIENYKMVNMDNKEEMLKKIRAFDFPGYEPAYFVCNGKKVYMRMGK